MVTTTRKFLSVLLSVVAFGHHLGGGQWLAVAMVFSAAALEVSGWKRPAPSAINSKTADSGRERKIL
jgi:UDP-galactose transporter B1